MNADPDGPMIYRQTFGIALLAGPLVTLASASMDMSKNEPPARLDVVAQLVTVLPDEANTLLVSGDPAIPATGASFRLEIRTPLGAVVHRSQHPWKTGEHRLPVPPIADEGGYLASVETVHAGTVIARGGTVLSVAKSVADDLRYGFYATYGGVAGDYDRRAAMLAGLHVNAVEFYDYFPAHGKYAPDVPRYRFGPFNVPIDAEDVGRKIDSGHERNILSLAYVAAYAASESVFRQYPYPMTDEHGETKIFNGSIMTEKEADAAGKPKWFWLMNIADDSPWHTYIMDEFRRTLDDAPGDLVSFDGFEVDTYGDNDETIFYAKDSRRSGDLLKDVLRDFMADVRAVTRSVKPHGLVSFNSVDEFGVEDMVDVTDFLFLEIWRTHTDQLNGLVDICYRNRAFRRQRVVLKLYPMNMEPAQEEWDVGTLARVLGATMTGGGTLMVVGEPDAENGVMHGLRSLYYPDHRPLGPGVEDLLRAYYQHDALLFGYTHGRDVFNADFDVSAPGLTTQSFAAPERRALVVQFLRAGDEPRWTVARALPEPATDVAVSMQLPEGTEPKSVYYATPDAADWRTPAELEFTVDNGSLRTRIPTIRVHGTLIVEH